ncbi:MAG: acetyl-CoA decarbonylase/synthase complex subunit delta [Deltaproteobacteria bacterium]
MAVELMKEKWQGKVLGVEIGATKEKGGTRSSVLSLGGQSCLPFLYEEGEMPHKPAVAFEVWDTAPADWPKELADQFSDVSGDPAAWAQKCVQKFGAKAICLRLQGAHPDTGNRSPDEEAKILQKVLKAVAVPLIVQGCGDDEKDNALFPVISEAAKGERLLIGSAVQDNYKTLVAACLADGHDIIAESPIDVNIAKQLNILITDMGLAPEKIVINPTVGALGYGLEYAYSIMERCRLSALSGDKMLAMPFIGFIGQEAWRAKEAKSGEQEFPGFGSQKERGIAWEAVTAAALLQAGCDLLVMRHPKAVEETVRYIEAMMGGR